MSGVARVTDQVVGVCCAHSPCISTTGVIAQGAATVNAEGQLVARIGDTVVLACGHSAIIVSGSPTVITEGIGTSRLGDTVGGVFTGMISTGAATVTTP